MKKLLSTLVLAPLAVASCGYGTNLKTGQSVSETKTIDGHEYTYSFVTNDNGLVDKMAGNHTIIKGSLTDDIKLHKIFVTSKAGTDKLSCIKQNDTTFEFTATTKDVIPPENENAGKECADGELRLLNDAMHTYEFYTPNAIDTADIVTSIGAATDIESTFVATTNLVLKNNVDYATKFGLTAAAPADFKAALAMFAKNDIKSLENIYTYNSGDNNAYAKMIMESIRALKA